MPKDIDKTERPPVVVVLGHVDHGKSTLLDYIRKSNVTEGEAGGITQHIGAYELLHKDEEGLERRITFIDTPGHAAFSKMRERGAALADIAILVVAADDGVKPQTLEALDAIKKAAIPYIVAINKIDKTDANIDRTKQSLAEAGVYVEGYGGTVPVASISAKSGEGVENLLSLVLLSASLEELTTKEDASASGVVIESHRDHRKGVLATLVILDGKLEKGTFLVAGKQVAPVRTLHNFQGKPTDQAVASSPVLVSGFATLPEVGETFKAYQDKKAAEKAASIGGKPAVVVERKADKEVSIPLVIKADAAGTLEALLAELQKRENEKVGVKVVGSGVGTITESDIKILLGSERPLVLGFNVSVDKHAQDLADKNALPLMLFDIIYKLTEWFDEYIESVTPKTIVETITGEAKILKTFSRTRERQVIGGMVKVGSLERGKKVRITRREAEVGEGKIVNLQQSRKDADSVVEGEQFGAVIESKLTIAEGDKLEIISAKEG